MITVIVEKTVVRGETRQDFFAVATPEKVAQSKCYSLTYEAHLTEWTPDAAAAAQLALEISGTAPLTAFPHFFEPRKS